MRNGSRRDIFRLHSRPPRLVLGGHSYAAALQRYISPGPGRTERVWQLKYSRGMEVCMRRDIVGSIREMRCRLVLASGNDDQSLLSLALVRLWRGAGVSSR